MRPAPVEAASVFVRAASPSKGEAAPPPAREQSYTLFVKDGRLTYVYNFLGIPPEQKLVADAPTSGTHVVGVDFTKERVGEYHEPRVALSPIPIIAVILVLVTPRARANRPAFVVGWLLGLTIVGTIVLLVAGPSDASDNGEPATWVSLLELVLGLLLVLIALRQWRARPHEGEVAPTPKWMGAIDGFTAPKALGAGAVLVAANPIS